MTREEYRALQARLREMADPEFLAFHSRLVPGVENLLGVRMPRMRKLARELARGDWRGYLDAAGCATYEETLLQGLVLGYAKMEIGELLERLDAFAPKVDNWAVCDSTCAGLKRIAKHRDRALDTLVPWLERPEEFRVRLAVVLLMDYYVDEHDIGRVLELLAGVRHEGYYARMAVAWALSVCCVKFPEPTLALLETNRLCPEVWRMALQKILESGRAGPETKARVRALRDAARAGA